MTTDEAARAVNLQGRWDMHPHPNQSSKLARYAGTEWGGESRNGALRWDSSGLPENPLAAVPLAVAAVEAMRPHIAAVEAAVATWKPNEAARLRDRYAPLYYDFHRAERVVEAGDAFAVGYHIRTLRLAFTLATDRPGGIDVVGLADCGSPEEIAREYLLWRHSLDLEPVARWPDSGTAARAADLLPPATPSVAELRRYDRALADGFGLATRSARAAKLAFARVSLQAPLAGTTLPSGAMIVAVEAPWGPAAGAALARAATLEMAHSLALRHWGPLRAHFDRELRARSAGWHDHRVAEFLSAGSYHAGEDRAVSPQDGGRGFFPHEFAHAYVIGHCGPLRQPGDWAPSALSLRHAGALAGRRVTGSSLFRRSQRRPR